MTQQKSKQAKQPLTPSTANKSRETGVVSGILAAPPQVSEPDEGRSLTQPRWTEKEPIALSTQEALDGFAPMGELFDFCRPRGPGRNSQTRFPEEWMTALRGLSAPERLGFLAATAILGVDNCAGHAFDELMSESDFPSFDASKKAASEKRIVEFVRRMRPVIQLCMDDTQWHARQPAPDWNQPNPEYLKWDEIAQERANRLVLVEGRETLASAARTLVMAFMSDRAAPGAQRLGTSLLRLRFPLMGDMAQPNNEAAQIFIRCASKNQARLLIRRADTAGRLEIGRIALNSLAPEKGVSASAEFAEKCWWFLDTLGLDRIVEHAKERDSAREFANLALIRTHTGSRTPMERRMMMVFLALKTPEAVKIAREETAAFAQRLAGMSRQSSSYQKKNAEEARELKELWRAMAGFDGAWSMEVLDSAAMNTAGMVHDKTPETARQIVRETLAEIDAAQMRGEIAKVEKENQATDRKRAKEGIPAPKNVVARKASRL